MMKPTVFEILFYKKIHLGKRFSLTLGQLVSFLVITVLAYLMRHAMFPLESVDYRNFLQHWYDALKIQGGYPGLALPLGDYTPSYLYILATLTYLPMGSLYGIKYVSCFFDFVLAVSVMVFIYHITKNIIRSLISYAVVLVAPTLLLNGAYWGQCDGIFTTFLFLSFYALQKKKQVMGMICFGLAFCFKLQAIFFLPVLIFLWMKNWIKLRYFAIPPVVFFFSLVPAWIAGRPLDNLFSIYLNQTKTYQALAMCSPNFWEAFQWEYPELADMAVLGTALLVFLSFYIFYEKRLQMNSETILLLTLFYALLIPYFLPHMHERYFYVADVFSLVYALYRPRRWYLPCLVVGASFGSYYPFLFAFEVNFKYLSVMMLAALILVLFDLLRAEKEPLPQWVQQQSSAERKKA